MAKQEKYKVNDNSRLNQFSRRKIAFSIRQLLHSEGTKNPSSLSLCVFSTSHQEPKRKKTVTQDGSSRMHHETLTPLRFSGKIPSKHKYNNKVNK